MKVIIFIFVGAFGAGLAVVLGNRLSADALGIVIGVVIGVMASVPTSLLLVWAMGRRSSVQEEGAPTRGAPTGQLPGNVFILPGGGQLGPWVPPMHQDQPLGLPAPRNFRVVGDEWRDEGA